MMSVRVGVRPGWRAPALVTLMLGALALGAAAGRAAVSNAAWFARVWQSDEGLPENNVTGVAQTPEGYLWVATLDGLVRFDGARFQRVALPTPGEMPNQMIRALCLDRDGRVWLALERGVALALGPGATNLLTTEHGLPSFRPLTMTPAADGAVWIAYVDGSACRIRQGRVTRFRARDGLSGVGPCWLVADRQGQVWHAKAGRVGVFRDERFLTLFTPGERALRLGAARGGGVWVCAGREVLHCDEGRAPVKRVALASPRAGIEPTAVFEDRSGALWIGTAAHGLYRCEGTNAVAVETSHPEIRSVSEDREGNLWVGTSGGGLNRLLPRVLDLQGTGSGLPFDTVRSVCEDASGTVWAAAQNGELARWRDGVWTTASTNAGWSGEKATCVAADREGVWIGTYRGGLHRWADGRFAGLHREDGLLSESVRSLLVDSAGHLWIGLESSNALQRLRQGHLRTFDLPRRSTPVRTMAEDAARRLWLGTSDGYLFRVEGDAVVDETERVPGRLKPIRCLAATPDGSLWIGFAGAGLGRLKSGRLALISTSQGLHDDFVSHLVADGRGALWGAGNRGLFHLPQRELDDVADGRAARVRVVVHGRDEGLPSLQANYGYGPGAMRSRDGRIWFPMRTGLAVVHPERVRVNHLPPPVLIERVLVDGQAVVLPGGAGFLREDNTVRALASGHTVARLRLAPRHRKLEIDFTALSFVAPENVHFRYRLDGMDEQWLDAGTERRVSYPRLPAGEYRFRVTACNNAGIWNTLGAAVAFRVPPFFWQTWWFRLGLLLAFTAGVIAVVRYVSFRRLRQQLAVAERQATLHKERERIAKDIHDDLGASLAQISLLGELARHDLPKPETAREHVEKLSAVARQGIRSLDEIVWAVNPRNDTLPHLLDYVGQFAVDFLRAAHIRCRVDFPAQPPARALATEARHNVFLAVKEALHNIVKHAQASEVRLQAALEGDTLRLSVEDNGRGFDQAPDSPLADGLRNLRQRLGDVGGQCRIEGRPGAGTRIVMELVLRAG